MKEVASLSSTAIVMIINEKSMKYEDREKQSKWFKVDQGMRQGCSLSPWLFNVFLDTIVIDARGLHGKSDFREENVDVLLFADDMGHEVLFVATSDCLPSHPTKNGRATDSCFTLIGVHQCGIQMVNTR